ncbi:hypothetical protein [Ktedonobacter racemifer]|nr:hypothetical protein [Ktedonobacter racemifer]
MFFNDVIFAELHTWSILTTISASLPIIGTTFFLLADLIRRKNIWWQDSLFFLELIISIWSLVVALNFYQQWNDIVRHAPTHGVIVYELSINDTYRAAIQRCQSQFVITIILIVILLFITGWRLFRPFQPKAA